MNGQVLEGAQLKIPLCGNSLNTKISEAFASSGLLFVLNSCNKTNICYECLAYFFLTMFLFATGASSCGAAAEFTNACENLEKNEVWRDLELNTHT